MSTFNSGLWGSFPFGYSSGTPVPGLIPISNLIYRAYRIIGVLGEAGRGYSTSELNDGIDVLNSLLDAWGIDRLKVWTIAAAQYPFTSSKQIWTIGIDPSGNTIADFGVARPTRIEQANIITQIPGGNPVRTSLELLDDQAWSQIKVQNVASSIPTKLYDDYADPLSSLYLWPYPNAGGQIELYTWQLFSRYSSATDLLQVPPGYLRAIEYNLALELAPRFPRRAKVSELAVETARIALAEVQAHNAPDPIMSCDLGLLSAGRQRSGWSYLIGE
jgi:hypothetical protein